LCAHVAAVVLGDEVREEVREEVKRELGRREA
jgi:hypothetical protein